MEFISPGNPDKDDWNCICGNNTFRDGYYPCDEHGNEMEPTIGSAWADLYVCYGCGRIINSDTLEVVGRNQDPKLLG